MVTLLAGVVWKVTRTTSIMCTCDATTDPNNPAWDCPQPLATACLRSE